MAVTLITGATGLVGREVCRRLAGRETRVALHRPGPFEAASSSIVVGDIHGTTDWTTALSGVDCVVHLAARVHVMNPDIDHVARLQETNVDGTARLGEAAAASGVRRFIYLSSIKVNGERTLDRPFSKLDAPHPEDAYGESKLEAERRLFDVARRSRMTVAAIRAPLVYGPGVKANFLRLMRMVDRGVPLPFARVRNQRSLVSVWNLADLIRHVIEIRDLESDVFMVSDGHDLSTPELIRSIAVAMRRPPRMLPVPEFALYAMARLVGRSAEIDRLCGSLTVALNETRDQLGWTPPVTVEEGLRRTVEAYRSQAAAS